MGLSLPHGYCSVQPPAVTIDSVFSLSFLREQIAAIHLEEQTAVSCPGLHGEACQRQQEMGGDLGCKVPSPTLSCRCQIAGDSVISVVFFLGSSSKRTTTALLTAACVIPSQLSAGKKISLQMLSQPFGPDWTNYDGPSMFHENTTIDSEWLLLPVIVRAVSDIFRAARPGVERTLWWQIGSQELHLRV